MAKILCGISGVEFSCEFLPIHLASREYAHPIFFLPQKKLLGLYQKYRHAELDSTSSYLLFCAYLNSTNLIEWRVPAKRTPQTEALIANNFESLVTVIEKMNRINNPSVIFSRIAVTPDTCTLDTVKYWIANWEETYDSFVSGYAAERHRAEIAKLEDKLLYMSRDANRNETQYASRLAEWADKAGCFPRHTFRIAGKEIVCADYWKQIIRKCVNQESIFQIPTDHLEVVIEHCEEYIDAGSTYGHDLLEILREGRQKQIDFLGLGSFNFTILESDSTAAKANMEAIKANAPSEAPRRIDYPSNFEYIKAKLAYDMKKNSEEGKEGNQGNQGEKK